MLRYVDTMTANSERRLLLTGFIRAAAWVVVSGLLALGPGPRPALSFSPGPAIAEASLVGDRTAISPGQPFLVALRLQLPETWHTYWRNPGDSGAPASLEWILPYGFLPGPIIWPSPERIVDEGGIVSYGHHGEIFLVTEIRPPDALPEHTEVAIAVDTEWLVCSDICVPEHASLSLKLPVSTAGRATFSRWHDSFARAMALAPQSMPGPAFFHIDGETLVLSVGQLGLPREGLTQAWFFPHMPGVIDHAAMQSVTVRGSVLTLSIPRDPNGAPLNGTLSGVLALQTEGGNSAFTIQAVEESTRRAP